MTSKKPGKRHRDSDTSEPTPLPGIDEVAPLPDAPVVKAKAAKKEKVALSPESLSAQLDGKSDLASIAEASGCSVADVEKCLSPLVAARTAVKCGGFGPTSVWRTVPSFKR